MATVPLSGTNVRLLSGVPFNSDYKNTRWFDTLSAQTTYFLGKTTVHTMTEANFQRIEGRTFISVNKSIDELWGTNYLMFQNASYNSKWFYAFVTKLEYVQKMTTYVHFEIDVFQTWKFEMNFKPSYVVREHCPLWNVDGSPVVNTVDEGLNYGSEYDIVYANNFEPSNGIYYLVIISKSTMHVPEGESSANLIKSSLNGIPQPLCYYIHPFQIAFGGAVTPYLILDNDPLTVYNLTSIKDVLSTIFSQDNAVNNIVSMYITEHIGVDVTYNAVEAAIELSYDNFRAVAISDGTETITTIYVENLPEYQTTTVDCGDKYLGFDSVDESKLLMYPYAMTILDDFKGNRVVLKNEYIDNAELHIEVMGSIGTSNKVAYIPSDYTTGSLIDTDERIRVALEFALINNAAQDVAILSDLLAAYFQGNRNSLENQRNTILFNGTMNALGAGIGGIGSAMMRNPIGVASSIVELGKGAGNTMLALQALNAKAQDINNLPPNLAKMGSNTAFEFGNTLTGFYVIKKQIKEEYRTKLTDFFKMFGYKVNEVKTPNFHTRQSWNYVQTQSCIILGDFNNEDLNELKAVFDNGITLWHTDEVGNYSLGNEVIS